MGNNYYHIIPNCLLCHSIDVGYFYSADTSPATYICHTCGYSWEEKIETYTDIYQDTDGYWWVI